MTTKTLQSQRGSLLIVAMLLSAVIGISLASYLQLSRTAMTISNRAVYSNAAMNLAEQGVEEAIYAINQMVADSTYAWPGWTITGANARRHWSGVSLSQNATGEYRVYVYNYLGVSAPKIISKATITLGSGGAPIEKWIEVTLSKTSKFSNGLVAKNSIVFDGTNVAIDSWNSEKDTSVSPAVTRASPVPFSSSVRNDNGSVGSISVAGGSVLTKNADVWGYVSNNASDGSSPADFVSSGGSILGEDSPAGSNVDMSRVSTTFSATFDAVTTPTTSPLSTLGAIDDDESLPLSTHTTPNGTGEYAGYYVYEATNIDLQNERLTITDKVLLRLTSTTDGINVGGGSGELLIGPNGYLAVYTAGPISLAGKGATNGVDGSDGDTNVDETSELGQAEKFQIWGTKTSGTQSIDITGNGLFSGTIYAPQGDVKIAGNGAICGSVVADKIKLTGNAQFHYDESLADMSGGNPFRIGKWKELTSSTDRNTYSSVLAF